MKLVGATLAVLSVLAAGAVPAPAESSPLAVELNDLRQQRGRTRLPVDRAASTEARRIARQMAARGAIWHTSWPHGEVVGMAQTTAQLVAGWDRSPDHRRVILMTQHAAMGVGVAYTADGDLVGLVRFLPHQPRVTRRPAPRPAVTLAPPQRHHRPPVAPPPATTTMQEPTIVVRLLLRMILCRSNTHSIAQTSASRSSAAATVICASPARHPFPSVDPRPHPSRL